MSDSSIFPTNQPESIVVLLPVKITGLALKAKAFTWCVLVTLVFAKYDPSLEESRVP